MITFLPKELLFTIFSFLNPSDYLAVRKTCKLFNGIYPMPMLADKMRLPKEVYEKNKIDDLTLLKRLIRIEKSAKSYFKFEAIEEIPKQIVEIPFDMISDADTLAYKALLNEEELQKAMINTQSSRQFYLLFFKLLEGGFPKEKLEKIIENYQMSQNSFSDVALFKDLVNQISKEKIITGFEILLKNNFYIYPTIIDNIYADLLITEEEKIHFSEFLFFIRGMYSVTLDQTHPKGKALQFLIDESMSNDLSFIFMHFNGNHEENIEVLRYYFAKKKYSTDQPYSILIFSLANNESALFSWTQALLALNKMPSKADFYLLLKHVQDFESVANAFLASGIVLLDGEALMMHALFLKGTKLQKTQFLLNLGLQVSKNLISEVQQYKKFILNPLEREEIDSVVNYLIQRI